MTTPTAYSVWERQQAEIRAAAELARQRAAKGSSCVYRCPVCKHVFDVPGIESTSCPKGPHEGDGRYPIPYV